MAKFLANIIDQMDLALDHLALQDTNYNRFALMLVDNALELALHKYAEGQNKEKYRHSSEDVSDDQKIVLAALGQNFESKVKLVKHTGLIDSNVGDSINVLHFFRNQVYHQGMKHESILPAISLFYFRIACDVLEKCKPQSISWMTNDVIPHRAQKYLGNNPFPNIRDLYSKVCRRLKEVSDSIPFDITRDLAGHMEEVIVEVDDWLDYLTSDDPGKPSRDEVIIACQAWPFAFTDDGKQYANENRCPAKTVGEHIDWLSKNYKWEVRSDPIPSWRKRLERLKREKNKHRLLKKYDDFMKQTKKIRESISESVSLLDQEIERQIDMAGGK